MNEKNTARNANKRTLILLLAMAIAPIIAAQLYFSYGNLSSNSNNGELIAPTVDIDTLQLTNENGERVNRDDLTHKWRMIVIVGRDCNELCNLSLYQMRQINIALGKHYDRFRHMVIHVDDMSDTFSKLMQVEYLDTLHAYSEQQLVLQKLNIKDINNISSSIYIMDPIGNIMMKFSTGMNPKLILKDLKRLLKVSQIG